MSKPGFRRRLATKFKSFGKTQQEQQETSTSQDSSSASLIGSPSHHRHISHGSFSLASPKKKHHVSSILELSYNTEQFIKITSAVPLEIKQLIWSFSFSNSVGLSTAVLMLYGKLSPFLNNCICDWLSTLEFAAMSKTLFYFGGEDTFDITLEEWIAMVPIFRKEQIHFKMLYVNMQWVESWIQSEFYMDAFHHVLELSDQIRFMSDITISIHLITANKFTEWYMNVVALHTTVGCLLVRPNMLPNLEKLVISVNSVVSEDFVNAADKILDSYKHLKTIRLVPSHLCKIDLFVPSIELETTKNAIKLMTESFQQHEQVTLEICNWTGIWEPEEVDYFRQKTQSDYMPISMLPQFTASCQFIANAITKLALSIDIKSPDLSCLAMFPNLRELWLFTVKEGGKLIKVESQSLLKLHVLWAAHQPVNIDFSQMPNLTEFSIRIKEKFRCIIQPLTIQTMPSRFRQRLIDEVGVKLMKSRTRV
ncbi:unnamed protein product [Ambrosiozyma monospora]|uniref:Unnamed protein product n=1 Tax=Ambrosiozyma monospora TaxID=43982 RepID=A0A9W6Z790_AMBMO|nr:unnamed protein product [Ambrosiozyma monospora]